MTSELCATVLWLRFTDSLILSWKCRAVASGAESACERRGLEEMVQHQECVPARGEPGPTTSDAGNKENLGTRQLGWRRQPATVLAFS